MKPLLQQSLKKGESSFLAGLREVRPSLPALGQESGFLMTSVMMAGCPLFPSPKRSPIRVSTGTHFLSESGYQQAKITSFPPLKVLQNRKKYMDAKIKNEFIRCTQTLLKETKHSPDITVGAMF